MISSKPDKGQKLVLRFYALIVYMGFGLLGSHSLASNSIMTPMSDGFDFPVGFPDAYGYYKARGFRPNGHLGEDWNGRGGGNTDLGDPVYSISHGVVVYSDDFKTGWGNVVIVRHAYRSTDGRVHYIDSLYGHLDKRYVKLHEQVRRGQKVGTIGTNRGMYLAHLHFEIRKNLNIGMSRSRYKGDFSNFYSPSNFIEDHRTLRKEFRPHRIAVDNFNSGAKNYQQGEPLKKLPELPTADRMASLDIDDSLKSILERHQLMRAPADADAKDNQPPRTMFGGAVRPERQEDPPEDRAERDKIRSFWTDFRETLIEDEEDAPVAPESDPKQEDA